MAFPPQFLDELRARIRLSDLIGRRVKLTRRGREFVGLCPFHSEKTPSFTVSDDKGFFHCFGCGAHGDVIGFTMQGAHLSFPDAVAQLAAEAGLEVPVATPEEREREQRRAGLLEATEAACGFYERMLRSAEGDAARAYLAGRGLTDETISRFRLGFAPGGNRLGAELTSSKMPESLLAEAGLVRRRDDGGSYDFFRGRVIFPITDHRGRVVAFGGRIIGDGEPKYLNSPDTPLFDKRRTLYGLATARSAAHEKDRVIVTEGYMDVIALAQAGLAEAVAPLGTALTESHLHMLWRLAAEPVLCFDGDHAGARAAVRAAERALPLLVPERSLTFVTLPTGEDPDSLVRVHGPAAIERLVADARTLAEVIWTTQVEGRDLGTPERLAGLEQRLDDLVSSIADRKVQFRYRAHFRNQLRDLTGWRRRDGSAAASGAGAPSALRRGSGKAALDRRREQVLLATIINHPALIDEHAEMLAMVEIGDPARAGLFRNAVAACGDDPDIDSERLKNQIIERGNGEALGALLGADIFVHAAFARIDAELDDARAGFREVLAHSLKRMREEEVRLACDNFVNDPSDENWRKMEALQAETVAGSDGVMFPAEHERQRY